MYLSVRFDCMCMLWLVDASGCLETACLLNNWSVTTSVHVHDKDGVVFGSACLGSSN